MASECYKAELYLVEIHQSDRYTVETTVSSEWNGRDGELCGHSIHHNKKRVDYHPISVRLANMDALRQCIFARQQAVKAIADSELGLCVNTRLCGVRACDIAWGENIDPDFEVPSDAFGTYNKDAKHALVVVHKACTKKYITGIYCVGNFEDFDEDPLRYLKNILINENMDIIDTTALSYGDGCMKNKKDEYFIRLDIEDIVCGEHLDQRYALE